MPVIDAEGLSAAQPESKLLIVDDMDHVLKTVSNEGENDAAYSNPNLLLAYGLMKEIVGFLE